MLLTRRAEWFLLGPGRCVEKQMGRWSWSENHYCNYQWHPGTHYRVPITSIGLHCILMSSTKENLVAKSWSCASPSKRPGPTSSAPPHQIIDGIHWPQDKMVSNLSKGQLSDIINTVWYDSCGCVIQVMSPSHLRESEYHNLSLSESFSHYHFCCLPVVRAVHWKLRAVHQKLPWPKLVLKPFQHCEVFLQPNCCSLELLQFKCISGRSLIVRHIWGLHKQPPKHKCWSHNMFGRFLRA